MKYRLYFRVICAFGTFVFVFLVWSQSFFNSIYFLQPMDRAPDLVYILQWTSPNVDPIKYMLSGQETFIKRNCSVRNCYVTSNRNLLKDKSYDVILFHGPQILGRNRLDLPQVRSPQQIYLFTSMESSVYYPALDDRYNGIFNITWSYKLNSNVFYGYLIVRNKFGEVIGPSADIKWIRRNEMLPVQDEIKSKLENKKIAAAWFVSNCDTPNKRLDLARNIMKGLANYNMVVDVYGSCGTKRCPQESMAECLHLLQRDYYFYFAFENSMTEDYVTEKLLHALKNYAVPVVFGGADYRRFMPDGAYLNAVDVPVEELVLQMVEIINDKNKYYDFFKWHNHYSYHKPEESKDTDSYCNLCDYVNNFVRNNETSTINNFKEWWNSH